MSDNYQKKILEIKQSAVERGRRQSPSRTPFPSQDRIPPGQYITLKFPVLDLGLRPPLSPEEFRLKVWGEVENPLELDWEGLMRLPRTEQVSDFHCVTRWSRLDVHWAGVRFKDLAEIVRPKPTARYVIQYGRDGYTTNNRLEVMMEEDVLIAYELEGGPIPLEHGGPVRMIIPKRYAWKGSKFLCGLEFSPVDKPGFWEVRGYHNEGDPWKEERYSKPED